MEGRSRKRKRPATKERKFLNPLDESQQHKRSKNESTSTKESQELISKFHTLNKYLAALEHDPVLSQEEKLQKKKEIEQQKEELGGLEMYQRASLHGQTAPQHKFNSGKWVIKQLSILTGRALGKKKAKVDGGEEPSNSTTEADTQSDNVSQSRLRLLDVGALTNNYLTESWLQVDAIDLNPQHPSVTKADFFDYTRSIALNGRGVGTMSVKGKEKDGEEKDDSTTNLKEKYDVVVLSLVLNFVGDPRQRGEMLMRCSRIIAEGGYLFLVLPLACITNSRYLDHSLFVRLMKKLRFDLHSNKESNKLCFYIFRRQQAGGTTKEADEANFGKRALCKGGKERNNFCILLQSHGGGNQQQQHKNKNKGKKGNNKQNVKRGKGRQTK